MYKNMFNNMKVCMTYKIAKRNELNSRNKKFFDVPDPLK